MCLDKMAVRYQALKTLAGILMFYFIFFFKLYNIIDEVSPAVLSELHHQLNKMRDCKGEHCTHYHGKKYPQHTTSPTLPTSVISHAREPFNKTKESLAVIRSPTLPSHVTTSSESSAGPLTSERPYRSEVVVNTPKIAIHTSEMTRSVEGLPFTTSVPTEAKVKTVEQSTIQSTVASKRRKVPTSVENRKREEVETFVEKQTQKFSAEESSPLPTESTNRTVVSSNKMSQLQKNFSSHSGDSKKSNREQINAEKPSQDTVTAVPSSGYVPTTVIGKSSEPDTSSLETNVSSILPTSASTSLTSKKYTSGMNLTVKPTREKSPKRRKNGERADRKRKKDIHVNKQKQKILKKSRKSKKKSAKESLPLSKENTKMFEVSKNPNRTSESRKNISNHFSENFKNEGSDKEQMTVEKPSQAVTGSRDVPTSVLVKPSEPNTSSSETKDSSALPTSPSTTLTHEENTSEMNLKEIFTSKPTGKQSAKRRKHGEREHNSSEMETAKTSKKLRKAKKKSLEKQTRPLNNGSSDGNKQVRIKTAENQTQVESKLEGERSELENNGNEKQNELLPDISRKRNKKPSSKRSANRNSKKRSKQRPSKRQRPSQISKGGVAKSGIEPPVENGGGFQEEPSPSEP